MKNQTGIWLDFKDAYIITFNKEGNAVMKHIHSEFKRQATKGGVRSKSLWGPQFSPPDDTNLEREKHEDHRYFQQILEYVNPDTEGIVIFGPAQAKVGLKKVIEDIKHYHPVLRGVLPSDYITKNEMVALVRDFFINPDNYLKEKEKEEA